MKYILSVVFLFVLSRNCFGQSEKTFIDSVDLTIATLKEELIKVQENYYVITPQGLAGNIAVYVGKEQVILVDTQWAKLAPRIKEILNTLTDKPISYIINTHFHFDHTDGNKAFGKENVAIIAHQKLRKRLTGDQVISGTGSGTIVQRAYPTAGLPSITFRDSLVLYEEKEQIRILHFANAHTDGDAIIHFQQADIFHTGDIFVTYGLPVIDENSGVISMPCLKR